MSAFRAEDETKNPMNNLWKGLIQTQARIFPKEIGQFILKTGESLVCTEEQGISTRQG